MKIEYIYREYIAANGKKPAGFGHWCFEVEGIQYGMTGRLVEAKKMVRAELNRKYPQHTRDAYPVKAYLLP